MTNQPPSTWTISNRALARMVSCMQMADAFAMAHGARAQVQP